jgi:hypothetical protein
MHDAVADRIDAQRQAKIHGLLGRADGLLAVNMVDVTVLDDDFADESAAGPVDRQQLVSERPAAGVEGEYVHETLAHASSFPRPAALFEQGQARRDPIDAVACSLVVRIDAHGMAGR